jgi:TPR repeat protein
MKQIGTRTIAAMLLVLPLLACESIPHAAPKTCEMKTFKQDSADTREHCRQEAERGDARAQIYLGWMYYFGRGMKQDFAQALKWFGMAAEQGELKARDILQWMEWLIQQEEESESELGDGKEQYKPGFELILEDIAQDKAQAIQWFRGPAQQGRIGIRTEFGMLYYRGRAVERDYAKAVKWFRAAAQRGDAEAQYWLGMMADNGEGIKKDEVEAEKWIRLAAEQGEERAQNILQRMERLKFMHLKEAAQSGNAQAQYKLGVALIYENVERDEAQGVQWLRKAVAQGHSGAQTEIGLLYYKGLAVERDSAKAVRWFKLAAEQGDERAQDILRQMEGQASN